MEHKFWITLRGIIELPVKFDPAHWSRVALDS